MYTKIMQNTKYVYILYTKIVQIKILYDNECTEKLHHISTLLYKLVQSLDQKQLETLNVCFLYIQTL